MFILKLYFQVEASLDKNSPFNDTSIHDHCVDHDRPSSYRLFSEARLSHGRRCVLDKSMPLSSSVSSSIKSSIDGFGDAGQARVPTSSRFAQTHQPVLSQNKILSRFSRNRPAGLSITHKFQPSKIEKIFKN